MNCILKRLLERRNRITRTFGFYNWIFDALFCYEFDDVCNIKQIRRFNFNNNQQERLYKKIHFDFTRTLINKNYLRRDNYYRIVYNRG